MLWYFWLQASRVFASGAKGHEGTQILGIQQRTKSSVARASNSPTPQPITIAPTRTGSDTLPRKYQHEDPKCSPNNPDISKETKGYTTSGEYILMKAKKSILNDKNLKSMSIMKQSSLLACRLADVYFGPAVLRECTLTGRNGTQMLDPDILQIIRDDIRNYFGPSMTNDLFIAIWKRCRDAIGAKCKNLRSTFPANLPSKKSDQEWWWNICETHSISFFS